MKLLLDENLSHKLVQLLEDLFPNSIHVRDVGLKAADDPLVWAIAQPEMLKSWFANTSMLSKHFTKTSMRRS